MSNFATQTENNEIESLKNRIQELELKVKEYQELIEGIALKNTYCCDGVIELDTEYYKSHKKLLKTFDNAPKNLSNHFIDSKGCLYKYITEDECDDEEESNDDEKESNDDKYDIKVTDLILDSDDEEDSNDEEESDDDEESLDKYTKKVSSLTVDSENNNYVFIGYVDFDKKKFYPYIK